MVQYLNDFSRIKFSLAIEVAYHFFLLRIHADHRLLPCEILRLEFGDVFKLRVAVWMLLERFLFLSLPSDKLVLLQ